MRIVVFVGMKLNYLRRWFFCAVDVLLLVFVVGLTIEIVSIVIDNLLGHGLLLQFGPINFAAGH